MPINKTFVLCLSLLCVWIVCVVVALPVSLLYMWLHPAGFWQRFAFALALIVVALFPIKRTPKSKPDEAIKSNVSPASRTHLEMQRGMRDAATGYGLLPKKNFNNGTVN